MNPKNTQKLINRVRNSKQVLVFGQYGSGKTVLTNNIKNNLDVEVHEDHAYKLFTEEVKSYEERKPPATSIYEKTNPTKPTIFVLIRYHGLPAPSNYEKRIWIFTSLNRSELLDLVENDLVNYNLAEKFLRAWYLYVLKKDRKTRPFLVVDGPRSFIGRYKFERDNRRFEN